MSGRRGAIAEKGDAELGERLFRGKVVSPATPSSRADAKGRHCSASRTDTSAELTESIVRPSVKIAQGFEPQKIATVEAGPTRVSSSASRGTEIELRHARATRSSSPRRTSMSPPGAKSDHAGRHGRSADGPGSRLLARVLLGSPSSRAERADPRSKCPTRRSGRGAEGCAVFRGPLEARMTLFSDKRCEPRRGRRDGCEAGRGTAVRRRPRCASQGQGT